MVDDQQQEVIAALMVEEQREVVLFRILGVGSLWWELGCGGPT
jgi:hypothetical protein